MTVFGEGHLYARVLPPRMRAGGLLVAAALATGTLTSCGEERSVESFCAEYYEQKSQYLQKYDSLAEEVEAAGEEDPLLGAFGALGGAASAMGDAVIIFDHLDKVAPDDIQPDVAAIRDSLQKQIDSAGDSVNDPLSGLLGGLMSGLTTSGSWQRVGDYVVTNCGESG